MGLLYNEASLGHGKVIIILGESFKHPPKKSLIKTYVLNFLAHKGFSNFEKIISKNQLRFDSWFFARTFVHTKL